MVGMGFGWIEVGWVLVCEGWMKFILTQDMNCFHLRGTRYSKSSDLEYVAPQANSPTVECLILLP